MILAVGAMLIPAFTVTDAAEAAPVSAGQLAVSTSTVSAADGARLDHPSAIEVGEPLTLTGQGWFAADGSTASVVAVRLVDSADTQLISSVTVKDPLTDQPLTDETVLAAATADASGAFSLEIPWPDSAGDSTDPRWITGGSLTLEVRSGSGALGESVSSVPGDVDRTVNAAIEVAEPASEPASTTEQDPAGAVAQLPQITVQPAGVDVAPGAVAVFNAEAQAGEGQDLTVGWESSDDGGATWTAIEGVAETTLRVAGVAAADSGRQYRAVFATDAGAVVSDPAELTVTEAGSPASANPGSSASGSEATDASPEADGPAVVSQPEHVTTTEGSDATFVAAASEELPVQWESSIDGTQWSPIAGATDPALELQGVTSSSNLTSYRAVFAAQGESLTTQPAVLTVAAAEVVGEYCGTSYGPSDDDLGHEYCFQAPSKVVVGQDIVISGVGGYFATDEATGSVINFFIDAEKSGDPNTLYTKRTVLHPVTGETMEARSHAVVQANGDGTWQATIPFPTNDNSYTEPAQDIAQLWAAGTQHSVRMLSGSVLTSPVDRQRAMSAYFSVVQDLDDEVTTSEPVWLHDTFTSDAVGDDAVAWVQNSVSGVFLQIKGTGWLTKNHQAGSSVRVRLVNEDGDYYQTSQDPADPDDWSTWQIIEVGSDGVLNSTVRIPEGFSGGEYLAVELTTDDDGTAEADVERAWTSGSLEINGKRYIAPNEGGTCTAQATEAIYQLSPELLQPAANVGGSIRMTGQNWCNLVGGGSLLAIKINAGGVSHKGDASANLIDAATGEVSKCQATLCLNNKTIWFVIQAKDDGSFDVQIPLPDRSNSVPAFGEGSYRFQILTRQVSNDPYYNNSRPDPSRTMATDEFTVVNESVIIDPGTVITPGAPSAPADALHAVNDLHDGVTGGVTVAQQSNQWTITVPNASPGDWVYVNLYEDLSQRMPWGSTWFQVRDDRTIVVPTGADVAIPNGHHKLSVQDRDHQLLGWTWVDISGRDATGSSTGAGLGTTGVGGGSGSNRSGGGISAAPSALATQPQPSHVPAQPVAAYDDLNETNIGTIVVAEEDGQLLVTISSVAPGSWVYLFLYTETGDVIPVGWVQVGSDSSLRIALTSLPDGLNKIAFVDSADQLIGWITAAGDELDAEAPDGASAAIVDAVSGVTASSDDMWTWIFIAMALLILCGSVAAVIALRSPVAGAAAPPPPPNPSA